MIKGVPSDQRDLLKVESTYVELAFDFCYSIMRMGHLSRRWTAGRRPATGVRKSVRDGSR